MELNEVTPEQIHQAQQSEALKVEYTRRIDKKPFHPNKVFELQYTTETAHIYAICEGVTLEESSDGESYYEVKELIFAMKHGHPGLYDKIVYHKTEYLITEGFRNLTTANQPWIVRAHFVPDTPTASESL